MSDSIYHPSNCSKYEKGYIIKASEAVFQVYRDKGKLGGNILIPKGIFLLAVKMRTSYAQLSHSSIILDIDEFNI